MRQFIGIPVLLFMFIRVGAQCLVALLFEKKIALHESEYAGKNRKPIKHRSLTINNRALPDFDTWLHYLKGDFDLVGPAPLQQSKAITLGRRLGCRLMVAPGMVHPHTLKLRAGVAHQNEITTSAQFAKHATNLRRLQLLGICLIQKLLGRRLNNRSISNRFSLFGVSLSTVTMSDAVDRVASSLTKRNTVKRKYAFVNADCANQYFENSVYKNTLTQFDSVFPDGVGVRIAASWLSNQATSNINGTDMFPLLCEQMQKQGSRVFLLGARPEVVEKLVQNLNVRYPHLIIAGYHDGYSVQQHEEQVIAKINSSKADLLLVAMGAPQQEQWIEQHIEALNVKAAMGVGGLFDFYSGHVSRAPEFLRELSMEWVWRLAVQPLDKGARYLIGNPLFLYRVARAAFQKLPAGQPSNPIQV